MQGSKVTVRSVETRTPITNLAQVERPLSNAFSRVQASMHSIISPVTTDPPKVFIMSSKNRMCTGDSDDMDVL